MTSGKQQTILNNTASVFAKMLSFRKNNSRYVSDAVNITQAYIKIDHPVQDQKQG